MMILGSTVLGWVGALAVDGALFVAFGTSMLFALRGTHEYLQRHEVGEFAMGAVIFVAFCGLFIGAWLPVGLVLGVRRISRLV
jgi:hypothetical protein